jgi:hypothetical protein
MNIGMSSGRSTIVTCTKEAKAWAVKNIKHGTIVKIYIGLLYLKTPGDVLERFSEDRHIGVPNLIELGYRAVKVLVIEKEW